MKPHPELSDLAPGGYAELLEVRLLDFQHPDLVRKLGAMDVFDEPVMRWAPADEWLRAFFDGLSAAARIRFRQGTALLLGRARPEHFPLDALREAIALAGDTGAHEAIAPLVRLVADGGEWSRLQPGPMTAVLATLKRLRPGGDDAYGQVCRMLDSDVFPAARVFDAFEILLRARAEAWGEAWLMLRGKFGVAQREGPPLPPGGVQDWFAARTRDIARRCMSLLSPWTLLDGIERVGEELGGQLEPELSRFDSPLALLWHELVGLEDSPFQLLSGESEVDPGYRVARRHAAASDGVLWRPSDWAWQLAIMMPARRYLSEHRLTRMTEAMGAIPADLLPAAQALLGQSEHRADELLGAA